jgi:Restriction endonuclease
MVAVVLFAIVVSAVLGLLLARYATNPAVARARASEAHAVDHRPRISGGRLRSLVIELLTRLGLDVIEEEVIGDARRLVAAQRAALGETRYVVFIEPSPPGDVVGQDTILELAESVKTERGATGLLVTPYTVDTAGLAGLDVPVEFVDGPRLRELVVEHLPAHLEELDRYRGFASTIPAPGLEPQHA